LIFDFTFYSEETPPVKYLALPHQYRAVVSTVDKLQNAKDNRGGIVWHTQGSGKSITMIYLVNKIRQMSPMSTILVVTDRISLDQQLSQRFLNAKNFLRTKAEIIESRSKLIEKLKNKQQFGLIFTTVQKFAEHTGFLSDRNDIYILVDEAHRSQNNIEGERKISHETEEMIVKFGYASFMRKAFPNAKITGFTGTPLMRADYESTEIFGDYNDIYSMNDSVRDGTTVPIYYETTHLKLDIDRKSLEEIDKIQRNYAQSLNPNDISSEQKIDTLLKSVNHSVIFENPKIIKAKAEQILEHYAKQKNVLHGKAMLVASSRKAALLYYQAFLQLEPNLKDKVILVVTRTNKDSKELSEAIIPDNNKDAIATEFRSSTSKYKIAIVVDM
jgi:type I restriction enzyme R subunit